MFQSTQSTKKAMQYICILKYAKQFVSEVKLQSIWFLAKMEGKDKSLRAQPSRSCFVQYHVRRSTCQQIATDKM